MKKILRSSLMSILLLLVGCQYLSFRSEGKRGEYFQQQWSTAQELLKQNEYEEAESVLKELYNSSQEAYPEISTKALFELAVISEMSGDWEKALVQLKECEAKKEFLPLIKAELELPARLSGLYATLGEITISDIYLKKTESGLQTYAAQIRQDQEPNWWAETYYKMGHFPISKMNEKNWMTFARRFESTCRYLIRSMEIGDPIWSQRSYDVARSFLKTSIDQMNILEPYEVDNWVLKAAEIKDKMAQLNSVIESMKLWKPIRPQNAALIWSFYESVEAAEKELSKKWANIRTNAPPSLESLRRNSIRREGLQLAPVPDNIDKKEIDPNL